VLINLLGNAIKFTDTGTVTLRVSTNRLPDGQLRLKASVEDSGREFVRLMGGDITLLSEPGAGAAFSFDIRVASSRAIAEPRQRPRRRVLGLQPGVKAATVLVADDEPNNRGWLTKLLTLVGFSVREARDGAEALQLWREWKPQLILMDMRMPVLDGMEATRGIRAEEEGTKTAVLALTASTLAESRCEAISSGMDDFLLKPCSEDEILRKVQEHLGIDYLYEEESGLSESKTSLARPPPSAELFPQLPSETIDELKRAVAKGEKERMNCLIARVEERDAQAGDALRHLADGYEYDALQELPAGIPREGERAK
jgi:CheY-like chemotaxis protein